MSVGVNQDHDILRQLPLLCLFKSPLNRLEGGGDEGLDVLVGLSLLLAPASCLHKEAEEVLVELSHQTEAGSLVEKVEFLVVFVIILLFYFLRLKHFLNCGFFWSLLLLNAVDMDLFLGLFKGIL
jgi:hypothetical protein